MHFNVFDKFEKSGFTFNKDKSLWAQTSPDITPPEGFPLNYF